MSDGLNVKVIGVEKFKGSIAKKDRKKALAIRKALDQAGLDVASEARRLIVTGTRSGNPYVRYKPKRTGIAGRRYAEPPKTDRGTLIGSIFREPKNPINEVRIGTRLDYGRSLELNGWKWLSPAFNNMLDRVRARLREAAGQ